MSKIVFLFSSITYLSFNIISDQRSYVLAAGFLWLASYHLLIQRLTARAIVFIILVFISFGVVQTIYRVYGSVEFTIQPIRLAAGNIVGRNGIEHSKTIHIINSVPDRIDYMFGRSIVDSVLILTPRAIFPEKSVVNLETIVAQKAFGADSYGSGAIPPGLIAEMFMNFQFIGIVVGIVVFGRLSGLLDAWFERGMDGSIFFFFYLTSLFTFGSSVLGSGFSSTLTGVLVNWLVLCFCFFISVRNVNVSRLHI